MKRSVIKCNKCFRLLDCTIVVGMLFFIVLRISVVLCHCQVQLIYYESGTMYSKKFNKNNKHMISALCCHNTSQSILLCLNVRMCPIPALQNEYIFERGEFSKMLRICKAASSARASTESLDKLYLYTKLFTTFSRHKIETRNRQYRSVPRDKQSNLDIYRKR